MDSRRFRGPEYRDSVGMGRTGGRQAGRTESNGDVGQVNTMDGSNSTTQQ